MSENYTCAEVGIWSINEVYRYTVENKWSFTDSTVSCLFAWGCGTSGQLGILTTPNIQASPTQVPGTQWTDGCVGVNQSYARKPDGTLWSWGFSDFGQLGDNTIIHRSSPVQVPGTIWNDVKSGPNRRSVWARRTNGTLWAWGRNESGELGLNDLINRSSPTQIPGTAWSDISSGGSHVLARKTDGTLWVWGFNCQGNLGINDETHRSSPVQVPGTSWNDVSAGFSHSLARKTDGTLWSWGYNNAGRLGDNTIISKSSPVQVPGTAWNDISTGGAHSLARKTDGTLWSWGCGPQGQLGDGTVIPKSSPVQVPGTSWDSQWNDISASGAHSLARKTDGTLWSWGYNTAGRLGDGTTIHRSSPVQVPGTVWSGISAGGAFSLALKI